MKFERIVLLLLLSAGAGRCFAQTLPNDVAFGGMGDFTMASPGGFLQNGVFVDRIMQSNRNGAGGSVEYRRWWGNNAAGLLYSKSPTNSVLMCADPDGAFVWWRVNTWHLSRNEVDVLYTRRFQVRGLLPYVTGGGGAEVLDGPHYSGLNAQFALVMGAGEDMPLSRRLGLRAGLTADSLRAPTYSDPTYRSSRTWMFEPRFGITYRFGFGASDEY